MIIEAITLEATLGHFSLVILHHLLETHVHRPARLPIERCLGTGRVRPALLRVVLGQTLVDDVDAAGLGDAVGALDVLDDLAHELRKLEDGELVAVAEVDRARLGRVHERDQAVDQIVDVLERARLRAVAVHGQVFPAQRLHDKVGHHAAVVRVHCRSDPVNEVRLGGEGEGGLTAWAIGVEYARDAHVDTVLVVVAVCQGLGDALALVIARSWTDRVDVAPAIGDN